MFHLLELEWKKLKYYRLFTVLIGIYLVGMPAMFIAMQNIPGFNELLPSGTKSFSSFPQSWTNLGYLGNWMTFFCFGFLGVMMLTMEIANKTLRQNIITGMSRETFFMSKLYAMAAISLLATLYYVVLVMVFGFLNTDYIMASRVVKYVNLIPRYWLMTFGYMSFAFFLAMLIQKGGIAIFSYFSYTLMGELILRYGFHRKFIGGHFINYYPMNAIEDLVPLPLPDQLKNGGPVKELEGVGQSFFLSPTESVVLSIFYILLFLGIAYWVFKRRDL